MSTGYSYINIKESTADPAALDIGNLTIQGRAVTMTIPRLLFTNNTNAVWAGTLTLQGASYPYAAISFAANRDAFKLEVGDCFKFSYAKYGITNMVCRVLSIQEESPQSEVINIVAMEDIFSVSTAVAGYTQPIRRPIAAPIYDLTPLTHMRMLEVPYAAIKRDDVVLLPIACRAKDTDIGFYVYMSLDEGASYSLIGTQKRFSPYGTLVADYAADTYTIDSDVGFDIEFVKGAELIETSTWANVFAGRANLALLGDELISFVTITPVTATRYTISDVIRGRYGTQKVAHSASEAFYFLGSYSGYTTMENSEAFAGITRKFKFLPYNVASTGEISDATAITYPITGLAATPYQPINFNANGRSSYSEYTTDVVLTWSARKREAGAGIGQAGLDVPSVTYEGLFIIKVYVSDVLKRTTSAIDALTWTYTEAMNLEDNTVLADSITFTISNYIGTFVSVVATVTSEYTS